MIFEYVFTFVKSININKTLELILKNTTLLYLYLLYAEPTNEKNFMKIDIYYELYAIIIRLILKISKSNSEGIDRL